MPGRSTIARCLVEFRTLTLWAAAACCAGAYAQESERRQTFSVAPYASIKETFTDNNKLTSVNREHEFITQAAAGVSMRANSPRLRGFLDYELSGIVYARDTADNRLQNALNAFATGEVVGNLAYVDVAANVSQQSISAFGAQSPDPAVGNPNRTEVSTFSVSPYLRGTAGALLDYEARLSYTDTNSDTSAVSDLTTTGALLRLQREAAFGPIGWSLELSRQVIDFSAGRENEEDRAQAEVTWAVNQDLALTAIAGRESNNFLTPDKEAKDVWGARVTWRPTPRTDVLVEQQRRFFGNAHSVNLSHRTRRTVWTLSDTRNVQTSHGQPRLGSIGSIFDLFYRQLESVEPDPVARQLLVLTFMRANGIDPNTQVIAAFLTSAVILQRQQQLSFAWRGVRDTLVVTASRSEGRRLDRLTSAFDDFTNSEVVDQRGIVASLTRRLTPVSSVGLIGVHRRALGSVDALATTLRSLTLHWSNSITRKTDVSLGARHAKFDSETSPYDETAVFAALMYRF